MTPVRAVLFDAFGTLFRPRAPIHVQYAQVAESYGLLVRPDEVKAGFKAAWKEVSARHPLYGKHSDPPLYYEDWWSLVIERTFQNAGLADSDLQVTLPTLLPALIHRFSSDEGYVLHDDVWPCLESLKTRKDLKLGVVSNSDPRTMQVLDSLGIVPTYIRQDATTLSWQVGHAKPSPEIFRAACTKLDVRPEETLMVGDDLDEDYNSARAAGLQAVLLTRERNEADYVRKEASHNDLAEAMAQSHVLRTMEELPDWITRQNA